MRAHCDGPSSVANQLSWTVDRVRVQYRWGPHPLEFFLAEDRDSDGRPGRCTGSPARVSVVGFSQVVVAALVKWFMEQRIPTLGSIVGMTLVVAATI